MLQKILTPVMALAVFCSHAQDSAKTSAFKLSGSADVYFRYNFQNIKSAVSSGHGTTTTIITTTP